MSPKTVVRSFGAGLMLLAAAGCTDKAQEPGRYHNENEGFSLTVPQDWDVQENVSGAAAIVWSPMTGPDDHYRESVNVAVKQLPEGMNLEAYDKKCRSILGTIATDLNIEKAITAEVGDTPARMFVYTHRTGQVNLKTLQYIMIKDGKGFVITCTAAPETYAEYKERFQETAQSFRTE